MSFECSFCNNKNNEILNIAKLQNHGVSYNIHVNNLEVTHLNISYMI